MKELLSFLILIMLLMGGCTYVVKSEPVKVRNIYSSFDDKIPGTWIIVTDKDMESISRVIGTSGNVCSAHKYPVIVNDAIALSVKQTMKAVFENTLEKTNMATNEELSDLNARGNVFIRLVTFEPRVRCFLSGSCSGEADIEFEVTVKDQNEKLFATVVGDSATFDGDCSVGCGCVADVLSEAISKSLEEALERMAEKLLNSHVIRKK
jgi:hypothetical protein